MGACAQCGRVTREGRRRYCSRACYGLSRRQETPVTCVRCGDPFPIRPFEAKRAQSHTCPSCKGGWAKREGQAQVSNHIWLDCFTCGAPVLRPLWRSRRSFYTFCSPTCRSRGWGAMMLAYEGLRTLDMAAS